jgi:hypothetical protein
VHDKLAELAETITRRRTQGFAAAQSVVLTDRGAGSMATIREPLDNMPAKRTDCSPSARGPAPPVPPTPSKGSCGGRCSQRCSSGAPPWW